MGGPFGPPFYIILLFQFPQVYLAGLFVQLQVAIVPGLADLTVFEGGTNRAVRFLPVGAIVKAAFADIGSKIREGVLEILLQDHFHLVRIEGGEARRIRHIGILP